VFIVYFYNVGSRKLLFPIIALEGTESLVISQLACTCVSEYLCHSMCAVFVHARFTL